MHQAFEHHRAEDFFREVLQTVLPLVRADLGGFFVFDERFERTISGTIVGEQPPHALPPVAVAKAPPAAVPAERWLKEHHRPLHLFRPRDWEQFPPLNPGLRALAEQGRLVGLAIPLVWENDLIGVAYFWRHRTPCPFTHREIRRAQRWCQLATLVAVASRLWEREASLRVNLEHLLEIDRRLERITSLSSLGRTLRAALLEFLAPASIAFLLRIGSERVEVFSDDVADPIRTQLRTLVLERRVLHDTGSEIVRLSRPQARQALGPWVDHLPREVAEVLAVPIVGEGRAHGFLVAWAATVPATQILVQQSSTLPILIRHIATVVERIAAHAQLQQTNEQLRALLTVAQHVATAESTAELLTHVERVLRAQLRYDALIYLEPDWDNPSLLRVAWGSGTYPEAEIGNRIPINRSLAGSVYRTGRAIALADSWEDPRTFHRPERRFPFRSVVMHPVQVGEKVVGVLVFGRTTVSPFSEYEQQLAGLVANELATALAVVQHRQSLRLHAESQSLLADLSSILLQELDLASAAHSCAERIAAWSGQAVALVLCSPIDHRRVVAVAGPDTTPLAAHLSDLAHPDFVHWLAARATARLLVFRTAEVLPEPFRAPMASLVAVYGAVLVLPLTPADLPTGFLLLVPPAAFWSRSQCVSDTLTQVQARLLEALTRWIGALEREYVTRLSLELATVRDEREWARLLLEQSEVLIPRELAVIFRVDVDHDTLVPLAATDHFRSLPANWTIPLNDFRRLDERILREPVVVSVPTSRLGYALRHAAASQPITVLTAPLIVDGATTGIVLLGRFGLRSFTPSERQRLLAVASGGALALHIVRGHERERALYRASVEALAAAVDAKDPATHDHSRRVAHIARIIARQMKLSRDEIEQIELAALLHDVGKLGIPDEILRKPGALSPAEWSLIRAHPDVGAEILAGHPQLQLIVPLIRAHHERWDGKGYPQGLRGEEIPVGAAIIALADAFDTMISDRPYRPALRLRDAVEEIRRCRGTQFHPAVVDAFLEALQDPEGFPLFLSQHTMQSRAPLTVHAIHEVGEQLPAIADLETLAEVIDYAVSGTISNDNIVIFLLDDSDDTLYIAYSRHDADVAAAVRLPRGHGLTWRVIESGTPQAVVVPEAPPGTVVTWGRRSLYAVLVAPLIDAERAIGALAVSRVDPRPFTQQEAEALARLGRNLGPLFSSLRARRGTSPDETLQVDRTDGCQQDDQDRLVHEIEQQAVPTQPDQEAGSRQRRSLR